MALPLVLAGPILRRVERSRVVVWMAFREPCSFRLKVWPGVQTASSANDGEIDGPDTAPTREIVGTTVGFGAGFHVGLMDLKLGDEAPAADPKPVLDPNTEYSYNVRINPVAGGATDLRGEGLLRDGSLNDVDPAGVSTDAPDQLALGFTLDALPRFVTCPLDTEELRLVHLSCRNANMEGDDGMRYLDHVILSTPADRPHQLFLTGDQFYADDVPGPMLEMITELANELIGSDEVIPVGPDNAPETALTSANFPAGTRLRLCVESGGLTTSDGHSHLIGLGEFLAMYVLSWSPSCWRALAAELPMIDETHVLANQLSNLTVCIRDLRDAVVALSEQGAATTSLLEQLDEAKSQFEDLRAEPVVDDAAASAAFELINELRGKIKQQADDRSAMGRALARMEKAEANRDEARDEFAGKQRRNAIEYRDSVAHARRVLANVPTYMICDDHEVTDDWNINRVWRERVRNRPLGTTILRNGLLAYAICQAWGNNPDAWDDGENAELFARASNLFPAPSHALNATERDLIDPLLGLGTSPAKIAFHFRIDFQTHRVVTLDVRNQRGFPGAYAPPALVSADALKKQLPEGPLPSSLDLLVVVSATPILSLPIIDDIGRPGAAAVYDAIKVVLPRDPCDFSYETRFPGQTAVDIEAWNSNDDAFEGLLERLATYPSTLVLSGDVHHGATLTLDYYRRDDTAASDVAVNRIVQLTSSGARYHWPHGVIPLLRSLAMAQGLLRLGDPAERLAWNDLDPTPVESPTLPPLPLRSRLRVDPVLVPAHGWPDGSGEQRDPDWSWRMRVVSDVRPDIDDGSGAEVRPEQVRPPTDPPPFDAFDPIAGYGAAIARHALAIQSVLPVRTMVPVHNVGLVSFSRDPELRVTERLLSRNERHVPEVTQAAANTVHTASLAPSGAPRPRIGG